MLAIRADRITTLNELLIEEYRDSRHNINTPHVFAPRVVRYVTRLMLLAIRFSLPPPPTYASMTPQLPCLFCLPARATRHGYAVFAAKRVCYYVA